MALVITPGQLARRAELYHQLEQLLNAGIGLIQCLETVRGNSSSAAFYLPLTRLLDSLKEGSSFADALNLVPDWMPSFDRALLEAGERSGRLPASLHLLADFYTERAQVLRRMLADLGYPLLVFHLAIFIFPLPSLFQGGSSTVYLRQTVGILVPLYFLIFLLVSAMQGRRGERWRGMVEQACGAVPILGTARLQLALSRLAAALEALLNAGVPILEAWPMAAAASGSVALRTEVNRWGPDLDAGRTPADMVGRCHLFPELFRNLYRTGEISGQLDQTLERLRRLYHEEGTRGVRFLAAWVPRLIYFAVALLVAFRVVSFYQGYFDQINKVMQ